MPTSGVDQVVRGEDLLAAAVNQAHLARLLGHEPPTYAHVPLAVNSAGARLAKRDGAVTMAQLASLGVGAADIQALIATSLGQQPPVVLEELLDSFDPSRLPREPWVVNAENPALNEVPPPGPSGQAGSGARHALDSQR